MTTTSKLEQKLVSIVAEKNFGMTIYEDGKGAGGHVTIKTSNEGNIDILPPLSTSSSVGF